MVSAALGPLEPASGRVISVDRFKENAIENGKQGLKSAVLLLVRF
jgi:hypothetical protein